MINIVHFAEQQTVRVSMLSYSYQSLVDHFLLFNPL